jgi:hypothetical protein
LRWRRFAETASANKDGKYWGDQSMTAEDDIKIIDETTQQSELS